MPGAHVAQLPEPGILENQPELQFWHEVDKVALDTVEYFPDEQLTHGGLPVSEYVPPVHEATQLLEPTEDVVLALHAVHELDDVPTVDEYVFGAQAAQIVWPVESWY